MSMIYHLTPTVYFESCEPVKDFLPAEFEADGFIHCSADKDQMMAVANRFYAQVPGDFVALAIDEELVQAEVRYEEGMPEPDGNLYPHIYGGLNRDAILEVIDMRRKADGSFHW